MDLYQQGLTDREAAEKLGVHVTTWIKWRKSKGLSPNKDKYKDRVELHSQGLSAIEAAEQLGIKANTYSQWRKRRGLPPNRKKKGAWDTSTRPEWAQELIKDWLRTMFYIYDKGKPGWTPDILSFTDEYRRLHGDKRKCGTP